MWSWNHFSVEGWLSHTKRSLRLGGLLILGGITMLIHAMVPFWQQPKVLRACEISKSIQSTMENCKEGSVKHQNIKM